MPIVKPTAAKEKQNKEQGYDVIRDKPTPPTGQEPTEEWQQEFAEWLDAGVRLGWVTDVTKRVIVLPASQLPHGRPTHTIRRTKPMGHAL